MAWIVQKNTLFLTSMVQYITILHMLPDWKIMSNKKFNKYICVVILQILVANFTAQTLNLYIPYMVQKHIFPPYRFTGLLVKLVEL
jgi:hypothetical protein